MAISGRRSPGISVGSLALAGFRFRCRTSLVHPATRWPGVEATVTFDGTGYSVCMYDTVPVLNEQRCDGTPPRISHSLCGLERGDNFYSGHCR
jgi:hypothetical protein